MGCRTGDRIGWVGTLCPIVAKEPVAASGSYGEPRMYIRGKGCRERDDACARASGAVSALGAEGEAVTGRGGPRARNLGVWTGPGIGAAALIRRSCRYHGHSFSPLLQLRGHCEGAACTIAGLASWASGNARRPMGSRPQWRRNGLRQVHRRGGAGEMPSLPRLLLGVLLRRRTPELSGHGSPRRAGRRSSIP